MALTSKGRAALRSQAAMEDVLITIGKNDITENTIDELERLLDSRELVKGKVLETSSLTAREACDILSERCHAEQVQVIGRKFVLFRKNTKKKPEKKKVAKPKKNVVKGTKKPKRTSYR